MQFKWVYGPIHVVTCGPSLLPQQGPDMPLPKIVTLRRGVTVARAVIGRSLKPDAEPKPIHDCVEASA